MERHQSWDVLIVGAGTTGCALAARLSEDGARRVLLLEAGLDYEADGKFPEDISRATSIAAATPGHPSNWNFVGELSPDRRTYPISRGKLVGGSGAINAALFIRGRPRDFETWASLGHGLWSYEQVLPFFRKSETDLNYGGEYHGQDGPIPVDRACPEQVRRVSEAFVTACIDVGFPPEADKNAPGPDGVGDLPRNIAHGTRMNAAIAYLTQAVRSRRNLKVMGNTFVRRVLFERGRAVGVEAERNGQVISVRADQVVLSAGGIKTPHLLMLSGIGPADALRRHGIPVIHDSPGVGRNIKDHPNVLPLFKVTGEEPLPENVMMAGTGLHYTAAGSEDASDLEISWGRIQNLLIVNVALNIARSRGEIFLISADPAAAPGIRFNYFSDPSDLPRLTASLRTAMDLLASPAFDPVQVKFDGAAVPDATSDATLRKWIKDNLETSMHTHNSAAMGPAASTSAVVDERCWVHGVERLRVADASIIPVIRRGPNPTAVMIGERVAAFFEEGH